MPEPSPTPQKSRKGLKKKPGLKKSRGGCITCKIRRVKCGEEKPDCLRCLRWGASCGGYSTATERLPSSQRPILPSILTSSSSVVTSQVLPSRRRGKHVRTAQIAAISKDAPSTKKLDNKSSCTSGDPQDVVPRSLLLIHCPSSRRPGGQMEYQCHQFFITNVAQGLSAFSPSDLWHRSILQLAEAEPFILDAIVAIGGIHKIDNEVPENQRHESRRRRKNEHQFAILKYQASLASMRASIAKGTMNARIALIACLLTVCFENAYGRNDLALRNCITGANMAKSLCIPILSKPLGQKVSEPATFITCAIEDELVAVFSRLDINPMVLVDPRPGSYHRVSKDVLDQPVGNMPAKFHTLKEASTYGNVAMTWCWHFIKIIQGLDKPPPWLPREEGQKQRWAGIEIRYGWNPWTGTEEPVPERWENEAEACIASFQHWFSAFEPLWLELQPTRRNLSPEYLRATLLRLQAVATMLSLRGCLFSRETDWDKNLLEFQEMTTLADMYLSSKPKQPYTAFEHETIVYLYYLLLKCRDGETRRKALQLMDEYPRREAFLDSKHIATVGRWIMEIEEQGIEGVPGCDRIVEESRMRVFGLDFDPVDGRHRTHGVLTKNTELQLRSVTWP